MRFNHNAPFCIDPWSHPICYLPPAIDTHTPCWLRLYWCSAFEKRSPGRQMRPINAPGDPEPHHRWSGWRLVNSPKFRCWHSSSIVFKLFIGCPNQNYYKIMYTHYLSSWIYKLSLFFWGGGLFQGIQFAISLSLSFVWISTFVMTGHPGLGWATQPPALGGPYGDQGFWFFKSTADDEYMISL